MRFYAVRTEAIQRTHQALQQLDQRSHGPRNPSRVLRVATFYGHLQCHADAQGAVCVGLRQLAAAWHLQRHQLRDDLRDLQALGWLHYSTGAGGVQVQLHPPELAAPTAAAKPAGTRTEPRVVDADLISRFCAAYHQHKPQSWPAYSPRGAALASRLRRAIRHAGSAEAFWGLMAQALRAMPDFWRTTYPQGRSGPECAAVLFHADRGNAGLGPELWHVFTWAAGHGSRGTTGAEEAQAAESELQRADRLLLWDGHRWRGQGEEALYLPPREKQRLAELLEAAGQGVAGTAAQQYGAAAEA
jgi:hypothetical protein